MSGGDCVEDLLDGSVDWQSPSNSGGHVLHGVDQLVDGAELPRGLAGEHVRADGLGRQPGLEVRAIPKAAFRGELQKVATGFALGGGGF